MTRVVRWGVLGHAGIARKHFIPCLSQTRNSVLHAIASRRPLENLAYPGVKLYDNYRELLDDSDVDAVYVPLPNSLHHEWAVAAMKKGKHVLCEKPIALNAEQCQSMMDTAKESGVLLMEAFMYRFNKKTEKLFQLLDAGIIGEIKSMQVNFGYNKTFVSDTRDLPELGGGSLYDVGCYCVDLINLLMKRQGGYLEDCTGTFRMGDQQVDQSATAWLRYTDGVLATMHCWFDVFSDQSSTLLGEKGMIKLTETFRDTPDDIELHTSEGIEFIKVEPSCAYALEAEVFANAVLTGDRSQLMPLADSHANMLIMDKLLGNRQLLMIPTHTGE